MRADGEENNAGRRRRIMQVEGEELCRQKEEGSYEQTGDLSGT